MANYNHLIPLISKGYLKRNASASKSQVIKHAVKETAKMAKIVKEKPKKVH